MVDLKKPIKGAPNFTYMEFIKSNTATRLGILNVPNEEQIKCIEKLCQIILQPVRNNFGPIRITSGFRSQELCLKIGSTMYSNHTRGQAVDFEPFNTKITLFSIYEWIYDNCDFRELIAEFFPGGWIHAAYRVNDNNRIVKLKDVNHNYDVVDLSYIRSIYGGKRKRKRS
jgi:hypothetical protein